MKRDSECVTPGDRNITQRFREPDMSAVIHFKVYDTEKQFIFRVQFPDQQFLF